MAEMNLTTAFQELYDLRAALDHHTQAAATEAARLRAEIQRRETTIATAEAGLDAAKIALAKTIVFASDYSRGGKDRVCFRIGLTDAARKRRQADLSADEVEAAIYYLANLERVQGRGNLIVPDQRLNGRWEGKSAPAIPLFSECRFPTGLDPRA